MANTAVSDGEDAKSDGVNYSAASSSLADQYIQNYQIRRGKSYDPNATWKTWLNYDISYNRRQTMKDIGVHLSERMKESISAAGGNYDIAYSNSPIAGFPGGAVDGVQGDNFYTDDNVFKDVLKNTFELLSPELRHIMGNPDPGLKEVDASAPGLAMGEAFVLNPDFQFNELDDVRSDFRRPCIGRLYSERIYDYNLPKVIFEVGTLTLNLGLFSTLGSLMGGNAEGADMSKYLRDPQNNPIKVGFQKVGAAIHGVIDFVTGGLLRSKRLYKFTANSRIYMRFVNEMLIELASWMNLASVPVADVGGGTDPYADNLTEDKAKGIEETLSSILGGGQKIFDAVYKLAGTDSYMGLAQSLSVLNILPKYATEKSATQHNESVIGQVTDFANDAINAVANLYVPFALQKGVSVTETFTNSTQEHPIATELNSKGQQAEQTTMMGLLGIDFKAVGSKFDSNNVSKSIGAMAGGLATAAAKTWLKSNALAAGGEMALVLSGNARFALPEIWADSTFDRSYNLQFRFRSPYGHRLAIFENTLVQTLFLIGMTAPRQVGSAAYMSPFYIRAFSKGLFSCELGMVSSLSITRGDDKNDRTVEGFSRSISVTMSIKDVVPKLMMGMDAGVFGVLSAKNVGFHEYLSLLAGVDMLDRAALSTKFNVFINKLKNRFGADNLSNTFKIMVGSSLPCQLIVKARTAFFGYEVPTNRSQLKAPPVF